jgi:hypothetical protein
MSNEICLEETDRVFSTIATESAEAQAPNRQAVQEKFLDCLGRCVATASVAAALRSAIL